MEGELVNLSKDEVFISNEKGETKNISIHSISKIIESSASNDNTVASTMAFDHEVRDKEVKIDTELKDERRNFNKSLNEIENKVKCSKQLIEDFDLKNIKTIDEASELTDMEKMQHGKKEKILCSLDEMNEEEWNQFVTNEKLFKTKSSYAECHYNTEIKITEIPEHLKKEAERIESELKAEKSKCDHINEERGNQISNENEEEKYCSVVRDSKDSKAKKKKATTTVVNKPKAGSKKKILWIIGILILLFILFIGWRIYKIQAKRELKRMTKIEMKKERADKHPKNKHKRRKQDSEYDNIDNIDIIKQVEEYTED